MLSSHECVRRAQEMMAHPGLIVWDTETTGKYPDRAQVCDVAAVDRAGNTVVNQLLRPPIPIPPDATAIHGITDDDVKEAPFAPEWIRNDLAWMLDDHSLFVATYNAEYDLQVLDGTGGGGRRWQQRPNTDCIMELFRVYAGFEKYTKWVYRLEDAVRYFGMEPRRAHRALPDAQMALDVLACIARS